MSNRLVVDEDTGKVVNTIFQGDRILRSKSVELLQTKDKWDTGSFSKVNDEELKLLTPTLTISERSVLWSLLPYVSYSSCLIQHTNGKDINFSGIVKLSGMSYNTVLSAVESLISKDVIYKGKNSRGNQFFINPWIAYKGNTINKVLFDMFKNYKILSKGNKAWKDIKD